MDISFTQAELLPFTIAFAVVIFILALELVGAILGFSSLNEADGDFGEFDIDLDTDLDIDIEMNLEADLDTAFGDGNADVDIPSSIWSFFELGQVPLLVWLLAYSAGYAMSGYGIQLLTNAIAGFVWPQLIASLVAIVPAIFIGKFIAAMFKLIVPKATTQSVSVRSLAGRTGMITVGPATETTPAMARVTDINGNPHTVRVLPYMGEGELPTGTDVVILRGTPADNGVWRAMKLNLAKTRYQQL